MQKIDLNEIIKKIFWKLSLFTSDSTMEKQNSNPFPNSKNLALEMRKAKVLEIPNLDLKKLSYS